MPTELILKPFFVAFYSANRATVTNQGHIGGTYRLQALQGNGAGAHRGVGPEINERLVADGASVEGQGSQIGSHVQGLAEGTVTTNINASGAKVSGGGRIGGRYNFS